MTLGVSRLPPHESGVSKPLNISLYRCPSDPEPAWLDRGKFTARRSGQVLYDAVHPADFMGPRGIGNFNLRKGVQFDNAGAHPGAWDATRWFYDNEMKDHLHKARNQDEVNYYSARGASLKRVTDGLSRTILIVERGGGPMYYRTNQEPRPKPTEWAWIFKIGESFPLPRKKPVINADSFGVYSFHQGAHAAMCDGSVRFLSEDIGPRTLGALLIRNDGLSDADL